MIIPTEQLKDVCAKVLTAVDNNALATITETLELVTKDGFLNVNITNKEYFVQVKLPVSEDVKFHATVNAVLFLKLIAQTTTENVELKISDNSMIVIGNGTYTFPLIYEGDSLLELPEIKIENVTNTFNIDSTILKSILIHNSRQLNGGISTQAVQKMYYIDNQGAITFTTGACVNSFTLPEDIKLLLNNRLVKLFKLFTEDQVNFTLGYDPISEDVVQTKVRFVSGNITLTAILSCDDTLLNQVPVTAIRGRANDIYAHSISISRAALSQSLNRMLLFNSSNNNPEESYNQFEFTNKELIIKDSDNINEESIEYTKSELTELASEHYIALLNLIDVKGVIDNFNEPYVTINFGNSQAIVISQGSIKNVIPECNLV